MRTIGIKAFSGCTTLSKISIPEGVETINSYSFSYCTGLKHVSLPGTLTSIGVFAFNGCTKLKTVDNGSILILKPGSEDHGEVARYAVKVVDL